MRSTRTGRMGPKMKTVSASPSPVRRLLSPGEQLQVTAEGYQQVAGKRERHCRRPRFHFDCGVQTPGKSKSQFDRVIGGAKWSHKLRTP